MKKTNKTNPKQVTEDSGPKLPTDLSQALTTTPTAQASWEDITTIARMDWISWIDSAKQPETRKRRIKNACEMLASGKRRPCCYSVVPMDLYKALGDNRMAKSQWGKLTPIEKRKLISWVDSVKQPETRKSRIEKACEMLASGKQCPEVERET